MKKIIIVIIEILLLFNLAFCLYGDISYIIAWTHLGYYFNPLAICFFIATSTIIATIILIAIKDFTAFQPLRDKLAARKQARATAKAEKAEADKKARIEALENELKELKKD